MHDRSGFWDLLLPRRCATCRVPGEILCRACAALLTPISGSVRENCGHPWPRAAPRCGECGRLPPRSRQALTWEGPAVDLIRDLKDRGIRAAAEPCADAIVAHTPPVRCAVVPVPASRRGLRDRGFDQAVLIAQRCATAWGVEVIPVLERTGPGQQRGATLQARRSLTRAAFRVRRAGRPGRVIVLDDVVTTGSTLAAAAGALRRAGWDVVATRAVARVIATSLPG